MMNNTAERKPSFVLRRGMALLITAGVCGLFIWLILFSTDDKVALPEKKGDTSLRPVSVINVMPGSYQSSIQVYGEVMPEWRVAVKSKVQGEILSVSENFRKGNSVKKGDLLLAVEPADYRVQLSEALQGLEDAETKLLVEQKEGKDASASWKRSGLKDVPTSPLLLRKPYLETAKASLAVAEERVRKAELQMQYTKIRAPFDGLVVSRNVSPGGSIFAGDEVGVLYGLDTFIVTLHLGENDWQKLPKEWKGSRVKLLSTDSETIWEGKLVREGNLFESDSRLRALFVEVKRPLQLSPPLLPGAFVQAEIPGRLMDDLMRIPDSARTQKGLVWSVDDENRLQSTHVTPVFREKGQLYYSGLGTAKIVVNPNNSFVNGLQVTPVLKEEK